ncbi:hypothetical protein LRC446 [Methanocella arvoryzae MRE50]|uniref:Carboxypeptidase regulatory-like domain-containing protein n=1 Tax=Methanocella arvoryzae (strain DSM 22066 / NBRC 105507 / MRE50) TaxID=351160 RepID=Q0W891_METAR|nr:hypothetical protein LRC446 [Methanocella arvoryzae MRE50]
MWAVAILTILLSVLLLSALSAAAVAKATATPKSAPQTCTIAGQVVDSHGKGIAGAKVTLYNMTIIEGKTFDTGLTTVEHNPQYTSSGDKAGYYEFTGVPPGTYDIIVDVNGMRYPEIKQVHEGTLIVDFEISPSGGHQVTTSTPGPSSRPATSEPVVTVIPAPSIPEEKQGNDDPFILRAGLGVLIIIQFIIACVALWIVMTRRL